MKIISYMMIFMLSIILLILGLIISSLVSNYFSAEEYPKEQNITIVLNKIKETN